MRCLLRQPNTCMRCLVSQSNNVSRVQAGLVTKLNARTSVLAAMNPIGKNYDSGKGVESNTGISGPLVSRFDIVMVLQDLVNPDRCAKYPFKVHHNAFPSCTRFQAQDFILFSEMSLFSPCCCE